ncbi:MAG: choice-of-anchor J domain-containing protein [Crocinitomicaceae bacterium]|nr:choice-of-anchor J domain-containing protein [Crocinitomicaceae bacterium]
MKKVLLPALALLATGSFAQTTHFSEDFADLGGWTLYDEDGDGNDWESSDISISTTSTGMTTNYALSRSWAGSALTPDNYMVSPAITIPGGSANAFLQWDAGSFQGAPFDDENYTVYIATGSDLTSVLAGTSVWTETLPECIVHLDRSVDISGYVGSTIHVVFRHHGVTDENGLIIDNVSVKTLPAVDMSVTAIDMDAVVAAGSVTIAGTVKNEGADPITSFNVEWNDGGTPNSQTFTTTLNHGETYDFTHSTPYTAVAGTSPNIEVCAVATGDAVGGNDCMDMDIDVASGEGTRLTLIELFTSSTCPPCYSLNYTLFDGSGLNSYLDAQNTNAQSGAGLATVKYQVDWPGSGDHAFNPDVDARVSYYGVTGAPTPLADGEAYGFSTFNSGDVNDKKAIPTFIDIAATHSTSGGAVTVDVTIDPYISVTGAKLYIALLDKSYDATGDASFSNGETEFHHVVRKMLPNGNGTTVNLTSGTPYTTSESYTYTFNASLPAQGTYDLHAESEQEVVVFVQDADGNILNSAISTGTFLGEDELEMEDFNVSVYPNPTVDMTTIAITVAEQSDVNVEIINTIGEVVYTNNNTSVAAGLYTLPVDVSGFAAGTYIVKTTVNEAVQSSKLMVK